MTPEQLRTVGELRHLAVTGEARALRKSLHIGLRELARVIGVSPSALSRWETSINLPRGEHALKWATALGVIDGPRNGTALKVQFGALAAGNSDAAGVQPAASNEQSTPTAKQEESTR